jgi:disulfide bond formation protein DsbB
MLAVALYYQYALAEEPCQVCIHVRLWVVALALVALVITVLPASHWSGLLGHGLVAGIAVGLGERAWLLYELENGRGDSSCEFQLGMPDWFAVDRWFPSLFEVRNLCSYTPDMLFGISMAEGLLGIAVALLVVSVGTLLSLLLLANKPGGDVA